MSFQATGWAKKTTGHGSQAEKFVLLILADYAHPKTNLCWPTIKTLAEDCMTSERTVKRCLQSLQDRGLITRLSRGNQHQLSYYRINLAGLPESAGDTVSLTLFPSGGAGDTGVTYTSKPAQGAGDIRDSVSDTSDSAGDIRSKSIRRVEKPIEKEKKSKLEKPEAGGVRNASGPALTPNFAIPDYWGLMTNLDGYADRNIRGTIQHLERACSLAGVDPANVVQGFADFYQLEHEVRDWKDPVVMLRKTCHIEIDKILRPKLRPHAQLASSSTDIPVRAVRRV